MAWTWRCALPAGISTVSGAAFTVRSERRALSAATGEDKADVFYRFWSMKEALIKALGTGFSLNPSRFEVPAADDRRRKRSGVFRFPHLPSEPFWLEDLGEPRFAAASACRLRAGDAGPSGTLS